MHPFWIATHDPHGPDDQWYVYLKDRERAGGVPQVGHGVLFYETENLGPSGSKGRKALVCGAGDWRGATEGAPKGRLAVRDSLL